jgi:hypothetical protein
LGGQKPGCPLVLPIKQVKKIARIVLEYRVLIGAELTPNLFKKIQLCFVSLQRRFVIQNQPAP